MAAPAGAPPAAPPPGSPPAAPPPTATPPAGAPPDATSLAYQQQQLANSIKGLVPDKQGNLIDPKTGQIQMNYGQIQMAVWTGALKNSDLPPNDQIKTKAQGGSFDPGGLVPAGNGSYTTTGYDGKTPLIITSTGAVLNADGTPALQNGKPVQSFAFQQALNNPNNNVPKDALGSAITDTLNAVQDQITKGNPIAGTARAAIDVASGHPEKVAGDLANGTSFGVVSVDNKGNLTPGTSVTDVNNVRKDVGITAPNIPGFSFPGFGGETSLSTGQAGSDHDKAMTLADSLTNQANDAGALSQSTDRAQTDQTRQQQEDSIAGLQAAANGSVPSAAEIQGRNQASIDAARQYGLAAALQGNNPGAALRQASLGDAAITGTNNANATALRATEQANARNALASTLGNVRASDTGQQTTDINQQTALNNAGLNSQGQAITSTGQVLTAQAAKNAADAQKQGAWFSALASGAAKIVSDKRAKKDIKSVGLADAIGKGVHGVSFSYKPEIGDDAPHFGVLADELEKVIPGVIRKGPSGFKEVHTGHLALANMGILSELARRIQDLEEAKGARRG